MANWEPKTGAPKIPNQLFFGILSTSGNFRKMQKYAKKSQKA